MRLNLEINSIQKCFYIQAEFNESPCLDLFSDRQFSSAKSCLHYLKDVHGFDIEVDLFVHICITRFKSLKWKYANRF